MTATHHAHKSHGPAGGTHPPAPHDPEHDIDAKSTTIWVLASTVVLFIALYFMLPMFDAVMSHERDKKIAQRAPVEFNELYAGEQKFLRGEESRSKKPIEQVMKEMVK